MTQRIWWPSGTQRPNIFCQKVLIKKICQSLTYGKSILQPGHVLQLRVANLNPIQTRYVPRNQIWDKKLPTRQKNKVVEKKNSKKTEVPKYKSNLKPHAMSTWLLSSPNNSGKLVTRELCDYRRVKEVTTLTWVSTIVAVYSFFTPFSISREAVKFVANTFIV